VRTAKRRGAKKTKPRAKTLRGYDIHNGKPTGREVKPCAGYKY
jgi:hypothetical protein